MRTRLAVFLLAAITTGVLAVIGAVGTASAHQCPEGDTTSPECHETPVYDDWRPNYIPLFDLAGREYGDGSSAEEERYDAQRWRDECATYDADGQVQERQQCAWFYGGTSLVPRDTDSEGEPPRPNELHFGYAANHCFLAEGAHDCDSHEETEFGTHDPHGGAIYVDICLSENPDSKYCDDGLEDTQAGVTIVDHLTCPMGCFDEYHVVRPFDTAYTQEQMDGSAQAIDGIAQDPVRHLCGYEEQGSAC